jgi:hypothetical protein
MVKGFLNSRIIQILVATHKILSQYIFYLHTYKQSKSSSIISLKSAFCKTVISTTISWTEWQLLRTGYKCKIHSTHNLWFERWLHTSSFKSFPVHVSKEWVVSDGHFGAMSRNTAQAFGRILCHELPVTKKKKRVSKIILNVQSKKISLHSQWYFIKSIMH